MVLDNGKNIYGSSYRNVYQRSCLISQLEIIINLRMKTRRMIWKIQNGAAHACNDYKSSCPFI